jgi:hypothetical protein
MPEHDLETFGHGTLAPELREQPVADLGAPVLCDGLYSGRTVIEPGFVGLPPGPPLLERQALHAAALELDHPVSGERLRFEFERTESRLREMQSHEYLARTHRA